MGEMVLGQVKAQQRSQQEKRGKGGVCWVEGYVRGGRGKEEGEWLGVLGEGDIGKVFTTGNVNEADIQFKKKLTHTHTHKDTIK